MPPGFSTRWTSRAVSSRGQVPGHADAAERVADDEVVGVGRRLVQADPAVDDADPQVVVGAQAEALLVQVHDAAVDLEHRAVVPGRVAAR